MKKLLLYISSEALSDLEEIWIYTRRKWSIEQADRYYSLLIDEIKFLQSNYFTGKSAEYIRLGYRVSFVKSHIIFYRIVDDQKLEIIRILHQSVNIDKWLKQKNLVREALIFLSYKPLIQQHLQILNTKKAKMIFIPFRY